MNQKRVFAFVFLSLMLFSLVAGFVSAQSARYPQIVEGFRSTVKEFLQPWESGDKFDIVTIKYLILALVWMVVWSVLGHVPGLNNLFKGEGLRPLLGAVFSFIVAFLALASITQGEIVVIMTSYAGLGFTIGALLPTIILLAWTIDIAATNTGKDVKSGIMSNVLVFLVWIVFGCYTIYRIYRLFFDATISIPNETFMTWAHIGLAAFYGLMILGGITYLQKKVSNMVDRDQMASYLRKVKARRTVLKGATEEMADVDKEGKPVK